MHLIQDLVVFCLPQRTKPKHKTLFRQLLHVFLQHVSMHLQWFSLHRLTSEPNYFRGLHVIFQFLINHTEKRNRLYFKSLSQYRTWDIYSEPKVCNTTNDQHVTPTHYVTDATVCSRSYLQNLQKFAEFEDSHMLILKFNFRAPIWKIYDNLLRL
jgi:hypothetical protein